MREFTTADGRAWRVWSTKPTNPNVVAPGFEHGWLTFESQQDRRRLVPIPSGWLMADAEKLELWCRAAVPTTAA